MIVFKTGDIFTSSADCLVNPTNFEGPMGGGLARQFSLRFPWLERDYCVDCKAGNVKPGIFAVYRFRGVHGGVNVLNFPTMHIGQPAKMEYIEAGLNDLRTLLLKQPESFSIAIPKLGCGIGGLDWQEVRALIVEKLSDVPCTVEVWE